MASVIDSLTEQIVALLGEDQFVLVPGATEDFGMGPRRRAAQIKNRNNPEEVFWLSERKNTKRPAYYIVGLRVNGELYVPSPQKWFGGGVGDAVAEVGADYIKNSFLPVYRGELAREKETIARQSATAEFQGSAIARLQKVVPLADVPYSNAKAIGASAASHNVLRFEDNERVQISVRLTLDEAEELLRHLPARFRGATE